MVWPDWLLALPLTSLLARSVTIGLGILILLALVVRRRAAAGQRWPWIAPAALTLGAAAGVGLVWALENPLEITGGPLPRAGRVWIVIAVAAIGICVANLLPRSTWRRRLGALAAAPAFAIVGALGVNAAIGITPTLGLTLGITSGEKIALPKIGKKKERLPAEEPLWRTWTPPAGMPAVGRRGTLDIPGTVSGFKARTAGVYLPPAALVDNPPELPVFVMMMGQPGTPDPQYVADAFDAYAARNRGLAPIAIVADQLSEPTHDSICSDTRQNGKAETYINVDVVAAIRAKFHVRLDRDNWAVGGYSNGGTCAARFGTIHAPIWGSFVAISPEEYPGSTSPEDTLHTYYHGDKKLFDANKIPNQMRVRTFPDTTAVITVSLDDPLHVDGVRAVADAAKAAGMRTTFREFATGGHGVETLRQGLTVGAEILGPRFGLQAPAPGL